MKYLRKFNEEYVDDFTWESDNPHSDNSYTMEEYLNDHLPDKFDIIYHDGSYAEILDRNSGEKYEVHAGGDGDFNNHRIKFRLIKY